MKELKGGAIMAEKVLKCYKCQVEHYIGSLSYSIFFAKIYAYSNAEAMRIAAAKVDRFKKCKRHAD